MKVGIVGFALAGKSTLFEAITGKEADPARVMKGQTELAPVQDARLDFLDEHFKSKKKTPAQIEFVDTPGLIQGEKADNPQRLATLRNADGLLIVLNGYSDQTTPAKQLQNFREELLFADFDVVTRRIDKLQQGSKKPKPAKEREEEEKELSELQAIAERLENGEYISDMEFSERTTKQLSSFQLFSAKPEMVVLNASDDNASDEPPADLTSLNSHVMVTSAKLEKDLAELEGDDKAMFMEELGVTELAVGRIVRIAYDSVGLISFFTVGEDECKAWTIEKGTPAVKAAGKIHTDLERGFIRAELCSYDDFHRLGNMKEVKAAGLLRLEGKEYVVADGDIINFRSGI